VVDVASRGGQFLHELEDALGKGLCGHGAQLGSRKLLVAIICIVLVMRRVLATAFIRRLISRVLAMGR
jgi:hypothetical protein